MSKRFQSLALGLGIATAGISCQPSEPSTCQVTSDETANRINTLYGENADFCNMNFQACRQVAKNDLCTE